MKSSLARKRCKMGAWGFQFDENDDAADWLADFVDAPSWEAVDHALAMTGSGYVEAPDASAALAAAEIVAAGLAKASPKLEIRMTEWASKNASDAVPRRQHAIDAVKRVRDDSELNELWQEADEYTDWQASVNETLSRL
ncbi:DUF4259 domain-containing protein [Novosphingobium sp.]|uniref:DUF4259 domain-containing protein n=1 Tax=Novosphingobium sp. TaxID=1874826 RepID=UPI003B5254AD